MAPADWRLISMWEGEPVGVDPRRPLLGFVLVAVLCAVLMTISVGRGFGVDLVHPGKPIATPPVRTPVEPPADVVVVPASVTLPDGLSADPYAAAVASGGPVPASASEESASESTATESTPDTTVDEESDLDRPWVTIVWNDPVNLMTYVTYVFQKLFGYSEPHATKLMLQVHNEGKAVVSAGSRESMEVDVSKLHAAGLWATMQHDR